VNTARALLRHGTTSRRVLCCLAVSCGTTVLSAAILVVLVAVLAFDAGVANVVAVCCGIVPSYLANRRWTWPRRGRRDWAREAAPFWAMSIAGLVVSTVTVAAAGAITAAWPPGVRSVVLPSVQAGTFAALWIVQFLVLDRVVFPATRPSIPTPAPTPDHEHELAA
jgi:putative flippase GtrA